MAQVVGNRVRVLRHQRGWSQDHLSRVSGVSCRTIQRIEAGGYNPRPETLQTLAAAFDLDVSKLRSGFTADELAAFEDAYLCPNCGSELAERTFVDHEYGNAKIEVFTCGHVRGWRTRPCPKDPSFPRFEDYELTYEQEEDGCWFCYALGTTEAARQVDLQHGAGATHEEAARWVQRSHIAARDGYDAAQTFLAI